MGVETRTNKVKTGMKPGIPWSVKGIDSEAREAAKHAARRSGMTLGEWLNTVIREQADDNEPQPQPQPPPQQRQPRSRNAMQDIQDKLDHLSDQLTRMVHREQDTTAGRYYERARPVQDNSLADILARVEASERQTAESFAEVGERLETLGDKLTKDVGRFPQNPEDVPGYRSLETAVRNIVDHIEVSERKTRETLKAVQERLHEVAYAATAPIDSDRLLADAPVITRLESRLADLTSRVTGHQEVVEEDLRKLVQGEFGKLTQRLDSVKQASEAAAQRAQGQAVKDQRDFEERMLDFLKQQQAENQRQDGDDMSRLRAEMESLGQRVDDLKAEAASEHDLRSLRVVIEQLSARVAQGPDLRPLADLDRRLTEISKWLEQGRGDQVGNQIADLEQRVFDLDNRIAQAMQQDQSAQAWASVEREFAGVSDRLAHTEQQLQHIQTLEQSINQLYQSMEQNQGWARDMAEDAANRMASRLMQEWPARAAATEPSPELQALETALVTVRNNYETADQRNQETLGALHETLEQIVNKLTELEDLRVEPAPVAAEQVAAFVAPEPEIPAEPAPSQAWPEIKIEATPEAYRPLDLPPPTGQAEPTQASIQADMIAAARRAAQAASSQQTPDLSAGGFLGRKRAVEAPAAKKSSRFSLFRRKEKPAQPKAAMPAAAMTAKPEATTSAKPADAGKRRRLILIGLVLLAAASVFAYNTLVKPKLEAPTTPPAVEQPKTGSNSFEHLNKTLAKSDAMFGTGIFASSLPGTVKTAAAEIAITDADALPAGIGTEVLRQAALDGDARAAFIVATRFADGKNVPQDRAAAARWFAVAAAKGLAPAQYRMGAILERGTGVPIDIERARQWYERAAAAGNVRAMHNTAVLLANVRSPKDSYEKAARWFAEAASHNLKDSQFNIALLYERGLGVGQDLGEALFWYTLAARQDDADAAAKAKTLENTLPKQVTQQVKARLAAFVPKRDIEAANVVAVSNPDWQDRPVAAPAKYDLPMVGAAVAAETSADNQILEAQQLLNRLGFDAGDENGAMSTRTKNSIRLFELQSGMRLSGEVTPDLLAKLRAKLG